MASPSLTPAIRSVQPSSSAESGQADDDDVDEDEDDEEDDDDSNAGDNVTKGPHKLTPQAPLTVDTSSPGDHRVADTQGQLQEGPPSRPGGPLNLTDIYPPHRRRLSFKAALV